MKNKLQILGNRAEQVIKKYAPDPFEFMRVIFDIELRPFQWEWFFLMEKFPNVLGKACPRVGKTFVMQIRSLYENLIHPYEEELIFAPKADQAQNTFSYQYDIIEKSELIKAYISRNSQGKLEFFKGGVRFLNKSGTKTFGVLSNFEGENATKMHIDEFDDIPSDMLKRIFGRGIGANKNGLPTRHRITGVIWGKLNIWKYENEGRFFVLPPVDVYAALEAGLLDRESVLDMRAEMTDEEWLRTMCLLYVEARNFIWSSKIHESMMISLKSGLVPVAPDRNSTYSKPPGAKIAFGLDMGAQGSGDDASDYSLQVVESNGKTRRWLWGKTWPGTEDPDRIINDVADAWQFFRPDGGYGDSLDANLIAQINDEIYFRGLVRHHWKRFGPNEQESWRKWAKKGLLAPIPNAGPTKHHMYNSLKKAIDNVSSDSLGIIFLFPYVDMDLARKTETYRELKILLRELENLQATRTQRGYWKIERIKKKIDDKDLQFHGSRKLGDDRADALAMSNYYLDFLETQRRNSFVKQDYVSGF